MLGSLIIPFSDQLLNDSLPISLKSKEIIISHRHHESADMAPFYDTAPAVIEFL